MENDTGAIGESVKEYSVFSDFSEVLRRARLGVREALCDHKLAGNTIAIWRDGEVVLVRAEKIEVPGDDMQLPDGNARPHD